MPAQVPPYYTAGPAQSVPAQSIPNPRKATVLPHAFTAGTLQDPSFSAWNMDTGDLYPVTAPFLIPHAFLVSQHTWHQCLGHLGSNVLRRLVSNNVISFEIRVKIDCEGCERKVRRSVEGMKGVTSVSIEPKQHKLTVVEYVEPHKVVSRVAHRTGKKAELWPYVPYDVVEHPYAQGEGTIRRSLYGLKQAPRAWFQRFASYITRVGFHHSRCDTSLFIYHQGLDTAYLLLYVDEIVLTTSSELLQRIIRSLHQEFSMTDLGSFNYFLGISVTRDFSGMFSSQKKYVAEILERASMVNCNPIRNPIDTESKLGATGDVVSDPTLYRSLAGSLQHLTFTRPDISYAVQQVCLHMHDPREPHFSALKRILRYVCGTLDYGLQLFSSSTFDLVAYSDADWLRQPTLSRSSAEAEYRGVANAVAETCLLRNLLRELHTPLSSATLVDCDNVSVVYLSSNPVQHQRTKHIEIDIHFVRDLIAAGQVRVLHVPSRYQFTDIFTKGLPFALFEEFRSSLSVRCPPAPIAGEC
nr:ribonuclease H-like domain-containing protein [Tanacetum cinerariifolium]